jgi:hypothetical protein
MTKIVEQSSESALMSVAPRGFPNYRLELELLYVSFCSPRKCIVCRSYIELWWAQSVKGTRPGREVLLSVLAFKWMEGVDHISVGALRNYQRDRFRNRIQEIPPGQVWPRNRAIPIGKAQRLSL